MKKISFFLLFLALLFNYACEKENVSSLDQPEFEASPPEGMMILGEKIKNPYSVENMKKALDNLKTSDEFKSLSQEDVTISTSHLYLRILPKNEEEVNWFIEDTTMEMFDYPLDYEIIKEGFFYQDPDIPLGNPTWLYTTVPVDFKLPDMNIEVLDECYIPDYDNVTLKSASKITWLKELENEAFRITGNADDEKKSSQELMASEVPSGRFRVHNTSNDALEGLRRVKVRVHRVVKWDTDFTDDDGYYQMSKSFRRNPHYAIIFENSNGFKIWGNWAFLAPANYNMGYHDNTGHSKDFWKDSQGWPWAIVNNSVCDHRDKCDDLSIERPPTDLRVWFNETNNQSWSGAAPMLRRTYGYYGFNTHSMVANFFLNTTGIVITANLLSNLLQFCEPDIFINFDQDYSGNTTNELKALVYHEASHASHYSLVGNNYWVKYINYIITYGAYGDGTGSNAMYCGWGEMWGNYFGNYLTAIEYCGTSVHWSDGKDWYNPGFLRRVDNISDVTTWEVFQSLTGSPVSMAQLKINLYNKTSYDNQVDNAYDAYSDWP
ncbi:MAG TPA: hypothetical protein VJ951_06950 [Bacteroidales bacterium]|nr:hypothetical protein [Bacteroidales bacterium]